MSEPDLAHQYAAALRRIAELEAFIKQAAKAAQLPVPAPNAWDGYNRTARVRLNELRIIMGRIDHGTQVADIATWSSELVILTAEAPRYEVVESALPSATPRKVRAGE